MDKGFVKNWDDSLGSRFILSILSCAWEVLVFKLKRFENVDQTFHTLSVENSSAKRDEKIAWWQLFTDEYLLPTNIFYQMGLDYIGDYFFVLNWMLNFGAYDKKRLNLNLNLKVPKTAITYNTDLTCNSILRALSIVNF